ncbi:MAG: leucyl aminopeptidase family protein [Gammaproteobacteria bacterium]|nr:leucyl aminopeptidase family protein [Gammaproteobacteria bacterium]
MHPLLPKSRNLRVQQKPGRVTSTSIDSVDQLLLILPKRVPAAVWKSLPQPQRLKSLLKKRAADDVPMLLGHLNNKRQTLVAGGSLATSASAFERLTLARQLVTAVTAEKPGTVGILVAGFADDVARDIAEAAVAAALAAAFTLPEFKHDKPRPGIRGVHMIGLPERIDLGRIEAEASGNNLARWFTAMPPNKLDAVNYADAIKAIAAQEGWQFKRYTSQALEKLGAGAFLAVAQGNDNDSASLVRLRYRPGKSGAGPDLSLIGKGIIFDTGGTNLKPFGSMLDMHGDMQGSAVALGTLMAISRLGCPFAVDCWLALTENRTGPNAYKSQDVITAANGKTIQTIHTDAEGRMVLADALTLASREKPRLMLDYATLTGAVITAITSRFSGVFTNRAEWHPRLKKTGQHCGERVWPFPIGKEFLADLKSDVADIMQCSPNPSGDHILAGSFLAEFIEHDTPWIHMDLAASNYKGGLAHIPTEITGFGVRYTMSLLLDEQLLRAA